MTPILLAALHHTAPWYVAIPLVAVGIGLTAMRLRRGGGRGGPFGRRPSGGGPFGGSRDGS